MFACERASAARSLPLHYAKSATREAHRARARCVQSGRLASFATKFCLVGQLFVHLFRHSGNGGDGGAYEDGGSRCGSNSDNNKTKQNNAKHSIRPIESSLGARDARARRATKLKHSRAIWGQPKWKDEPLLSARTVLLICDKSNATLIG